MDIFKTVTQAITILTNYEDASPQDIGIEIKGKAISDLFQANQK